MAQQNRQQRAQERAQRDRVQHQTQSTTPARAQLLELVRRSQGDNAHNRLLLIGL